MLIGAHVREDDPIVSAAERGAEIVQMFLADPQGWKKPPVHPQAEALRGGDLAVVVHSPVRGEPRVAQQPHPHPVAQARHPARRRGRRRSGRSGWWCTAGTSPRGTTRRTGVDNWRKFLSRQEDEGGFPVPIFIENTAGGDHAMARRFEALARLWDAVGEFGVGFCLDTCHAFAAGEDLVDVVERARAITGRIDLVHLNDSRDEFGSARDRHANIGEGTIDPEQLAAVCAAAERAGRRRDPGRRSGRGHRLPPRAAGGRAVAAGKGSPPGPRRDP